jgi:hypothetical protein
MWAHHGRGAGRVCRLAVLGCAVAVAGMLAPGSAAHAAAKRQILVFGDSIMKESAPTLKAASGATLTYTVKNMAGRSPCDYLKVAPKLFEKTAHGQRVHYDLFVIQTAGNSSSKCMKTPGGKGYLTIGSPQWEARYRTDLDALVDYVATFNTPVLVVSAPPMGGAQVVRDDVYNTVEPQLQADRPAVHFSDDARRAVSDDGGQFITELPCLPDETAADGCSQGMITVRAPDDVHFCPSGFSNKIKGTGCAIYDSGGIRYGVGIDDAAQAVLAPQHTHT